MIHNISRFIAALAIILLTAQTAGATETSTINVGGTDYTLFTGFTATDGTAVDNAFVYGNMVDGDILAIVTKRQGLDTSHIGIAEWGSDGYLHLLHASKIFKKVILGSRPIHKYMATQKLQQGVWVIRARGKRQLKIV